MDRSNTLSSVPEPVPALPVDNDYVGNDYIHKNAIGDGRYSIHATADILYVDIIEICNEFRIYAGIELSIIDNLYIQPTNSLQVQGYITKQRLSPAPLTTPTDTCM